ncbi:hypothetical protein SAMN05192541_14128 [Bradyrhizobium arachidis]|nr:hypothetical protein SAMN05192541_14128 [Bradyrhizobium arachidis]
MRVPGFPAGSSSASAIQLPSRPAGSVLHRPKTRGKVSNIPDRHVDLQCQPDSKCSARVPVVAKEASNALWPLGREYPEACQRSKADTPVTIASQTVLWRQTCSQFSSGTWSRRSAAPTEHSARGISRAERKHRDARTSESRQRGHRSGANCRLLTWHEECKSSACPVSSCWACLAQQLEAVAGNEVSGA